VAAEYLGMLGATVIKLERPQGEPVRHMRPAIGDACTTFLGNNFGKYGLALDLKTERERALNLISHADVAIDNFRSPDVMKRLGLDYYDVLQPDNPRLVYIQASAFGPSGPWKGMASIEWIAQAASGMTGATGATGGLPEYARGAAYLDWTGAMMNVIGALAGLHYRERTGRGLMIETSQFGSAFYTSMSRIFGFEVDGAPLGGSRGTGFVPDEAFETRDGFVSVGAPDQNTWRALCTAIERPDLAAAYPTNAGRVEHYWALREELSRTFAQRPTADWIATLRAARVPTAQPDPTNRIGQQLLASDHVAANRMLEWHDSHWGKLLTQAPHWRFTARPSGIRRPPPDLGEHNDLINAFVDHGTRPPTSHTTDPSAAQTEQPDLSKVLHGRRVVEVGDGLPLAVCGRLLSDLGAHVTKVQPSGEDTIRDWGGAQGAGRLWRALNGAKEIRRTDADPVSGFADFDALVGQADVVIAAGTPSSRVHAGIGYDQISALNGQVVYCGISGWGDDGPLAEQPATELDIQLAAGMTSTVGQRREPPVRLGYDLVSFNTAFAAVQGVLAALIPSPQQTAIGEHIEVSMLQTSIGLSQMNIVAESGVDEEIGRNFDSYNWPRDHGWALKDGRVLITFGGYEDSWSQFFIELGRVDLLHDPRFRTIEELRDHEYLLPSLLADEVAKFDYSSMQVLVRDRLNGTIVPMHTPGAVLSHPHTKALGLVLTREDGEHEYRLPLIVSQRPT
jgi:crotonobetainyl-CoA:carnitine CoA-transferase CaiB-like acyl-CoA transferase